MEANLNIEKYISLTGFRCSINNDVILYDRKMFYKWNFEMHGLDIKEIYDKWNILFTNINGCKIYF